MENSFAINGTTSNWFRLAKSFNGNSIFLSIPLSFFHSTIHLPQKIRPYFHRNIARFDHRSLQLIPVDFLPLDKLQYSWAKVKLLGIPLIFWLISLGVNPLLLGILV